MNTLQIEFILNNALRGRKAKFLGVFSRDTIPQPEQFPCCFVANTDLSSEGGSHWVAFFLDSFQNVEFFDSYGMPPSFYQFDFPLARYNSHQFQSFDSDVCGHYCILYISKRADKHSLSSITQALSKCGRHSDHYVKVYVNHLICSLGLTLPLHSQGQSCSSRKK